MALKTYNLTRPEDGTEFSMLLDDDDRTKYATAGWNPQLVDGAPDDSAPRSRTRSRGKADDVTVTD